jgi:hypothetical protein
MFRCFASRFFMLVGGGRNNEPRSQRRKRAWLSLNAGEYAAQFPAKPAAYARSLMRTQLPPVNATGLPEKTPDELRGRSVLEVARMDAEVKQLLNATLDHYQDQYRGNIRRVIVGTLDECVRRGTLPRHTLISIELGPRIVTAEQYEAEQPTSAWSPTPTRRSGSWPTDSPSRPGPRAAACGRFPAWASPRGSSAQWDCGSGRRWECASPTSRSAPAGPVTCTCAGCPRRLHGASDHWLSTQPLELAAVLPPQGSRPSPTRKREKAPSVFPWTGTVGRCLFCRGTEARLHPEIRRNGEPGRPHQGAAGPRAPTPPECRVRRGFGRPRDRST